MQRVLDRPCYYLPSLIRAVDSVCEIKIRPDLRVTGSDPSRERLRAARHDHTAFSIHLNSLYFHHVQRSATVAAVQHIFAEWVWWQLCQ